MLQANDGSNRKRCSNGHDPNDIGRKPSHRTRTYLLFQEIAS